MTKNIIINWYKKAKAVEEIYDFFDDDTVDTYNGYKSDKNKSFNVVDFDTLDKGEIPTVEIDDDEEYLVDSYGEEKTIDEEEEKDREFDEKMREPYVPPSVDIPSFGNSIEAINDAIKNKKVLKIDYSTKKGIKLTRYVEPHLVYNSKKGDLIVVTYDRSVRDIRSFIVNNITNYTLTGKEFKERMRVMPKNENKKVIPKSEKGIKNMSNVNNSLIKVATELKEKGLEKSAIVIEDVIKVIKEAQYVGVQGYWLRNRRCWDNCYRHKRTTEPKKAAQEVWMECWDEYLKAINNPKDDWAKYASIDKKVNKEEFNKFNKKFAEEVNSKVDNGMGLPETIYSILNNKEEEYKNEIISQASNLTELAVSLNENGFKDLSIKVAEASNKVLKEAGFFGWLGEKVKNWAAKKGKLLKELQYISTQSIDLSRRLKQQLRYTKQPARAFNIKEIKESQRHSVRGPGGRFAPNTPTTSPEITPSIEAPTSAPVDAPPSTPQQQNYEVDYIQEAQGLAEDAKWAIAWIGSNVPQDNPRVKNIVQTALYNLTNASEGIDNLILGKNINIGSLIKVVDEMTKAANLAMRSIYNEADKIISDQNKDGINDTQQVDQNKNNIDDRIETSTFPIPQTDQSHQFYSFKDIPKKTKDGYINLIKSLPPNYKKYVKYLLDLYP